jgi:hypothetical protein
MRPLDFLMLPLDFPAPGNSRLLCPNRAPVRSSPFRARLGLRHGVAGGKRRRQNGGKP